MKNLLTKITAIFLFAVMFLSFFTACKGDIKDSNGQDDITDKQETENTPLDDTPDIKDGKLIFRQGEGVTFNSDSLYVSSKSLPGVPKTYEAWVKLPDDVTNGVGAIIGDYVNGTTYSLGFQIAENGVPQLDYRIGSGGGQAMITDFDQAKIKSGEWVHLAIVDDVSTGVMNCYLNGELAQSVTLSNDQKSFKRSHASTVAAIGSDTRDGLGLAFKGWIRSVTLYSDVRTPDEIKQDMTFIYLSDENLMSCYDISNSNGKTVFTDYKGDLDFTNNRKTSDWIDPSEVEAPKDYDYSIAVLGDTQMLAGYYPELFPKVFDWLLKNKDTHKIAHVLNVGDITNFNYDEEWELCVDQYFRLNGVLDYTLVRGDHDYRNDNIKNNGVDSKKYDKYFGVDEYLSRFNTDGAGYSQIQGTSITNSYRRVKLGNTNYLILTLDIDMNTSLIEWANNIIKQYPDDKVIMTTHRYINPDGSRMIDGDVKWENILSKFSNVQFAICGHKINKDIVWSKDRGQNGNVVNQVLVNPQGGGMDNHGAAGMVCMLYFKEGSDTVQVRYYSTILDKYYSWDNQFTVNIKNMENTTPLK